MKILLDPKIPLPLPRNASGYLCYHFWIVQALRAIKQFNPKQNDFCTEAEKMHHQAWPERQAVQQTGHPTPPVFRRRAQNYTQGSSGEQHRALAPPHQILDLDDLFQPSPAAWWHSWLILPLPGELRAGQSMEGQDLPQNTVGRFSTAANGKHKWKVPLKSY